MGTFDSVYKNKIRLLEEENRKLKQILSEADILGGDIVDAFMKSTKRGNTKNLPKAEEGTPAAFGMTARAATDRVMGNKTPFHQMTPEQAFRYGADHGMLQGISTPPHFFNNPHFTAGFNSMLRTGGEQDDVPDLKGYDLPKDYDGPYAEELD